MKTSFNGITIEVVEGDITEQGDIEAVVNAANAELRPGGGVAGAIHAAAGAKLDLECRGLAPIETGEAVITDAYRLPNKKVIHTLGPVYGKDSPEEKLLADCYNNSLELAEKHGLTSVAFPAISTGAFRYPAEKAAKIALKTVKKKTEELEKVQKIRFVLFGEGILKVHEEALKELR